MNSLQSFIGASSAKGFFGQLLRQELNGSFLLVGEDGLGKESFALALAAELHGGIRGDPDLMLLSGGESIGVDQIRGEFNKFLSLKPVRHRTKIAIISHLERLTEEASNALLKVLEEPPNYALILLTAPSTGRLLPTIVSRCLIVRFGPVPEVQLAEHLKTRGFQDASQLASLARGRVGWAIQLAQDLKLRSQVEASLREVIELLSLSLSERLARVNEGLKSEELEDQFRRWLSAAHLLLDYLSGVAPLEIKLPPQATLNNVARLAAGLEKALFQLGRNQNSNLVYTELLLALN